MRLFVPLLTMLDFEQEAVEVVVASEMVLGVALEVAVLVPGVTVVMVLVAMVTMA